MDASPVTQDVVLIKDSVVDQWTAHLVELDVAAQGRTIPDALKEVQYVLAAATARAASSDTALNVAVGAAPAEYRKQFESGIPVVVTMPNVPSIEPPLPVAVPTLGEARVV